MVDYDFRTCEFISKKMRFITYFDFCDKCDIIKKLYKGLSSSEQLFYKWYIYANIHMNETYKNAIWDFLNFEEIEYKMDMIRLKRTYHVK